MRQKKWLPFILAVLLWCGGCAAQQAENSVSDSTGTVLATAESETETEKTPKESGFQSETEQKETEENPAASAGTKAAAGIKAQDDDSVKIAAIIGRMTLEEKAAQLFIVLPEALADGVSTVTQAGDVTREAINNFPVSGFVYMQNNLQSPEQVTEMLANVQSYSMERIGLPAFLSVDEEGGKVARISGTGSFNIPGFEGMDEVGQSQDTERAKEIGQTIGAYLSDFGFNLDFAPVADVWSNPQNEVIRQRSFGSDPALVSDMALNVLEGLSEQGVYACYKHFPGHGMTAGDTHDGYAYSDKTLEEIEQCELIPFQNGIRAGVSFIMAGHISLPQLTGDNTPASLSKALIGDLLRDGMGYDGIVITDAMNMGAIAGQYSSAEAAVRAIAAGVDLVLMPKDFKEAYTGVIEAVKNGTLSTERIDESLTRILKVKLQMLKKEEQ